jgi:phosphoribosylformylglycinamidine synthase
VKKAFVPKFPGTNCEEESLLWFSDNLEVESHILDLTKPEHKNISATDVAAILIPGGFSYGDYLRAGALASRSASLDWVKSHVQNNVPVIGICNGFQILCESGLLPGVLVKNITKQHHHFPVEITWEESILAGASPEGGAPHGAASQTACVWLPQELKNHQLKNQPLSIPMSCGMGRWLPPPVEALEQNEAWKNQVVLRYVNNENGSHESIAALTNTSGNVLGIMPHPERASDEMVGGDQGLVFLWGLAQSQNLSVKPGSALEQFIKKYPSYAPRATAGQERTS